MKPTLPRSPPRFNVDMPVRYRLANSGADLKLGQIVNMSQSGICLYTKSKFHAGDVLEVITESFDKKGLKRRRILKAKVKWVRADRVGLEFTKRALSAKK